MKQDRQQYTIRTLTKILRIIKKYPFQTTNFIAKQVKVCHATALSYLFELKRRKVIGYNKYGKRLCWYLKSGR